MTGPGPPPPSRDRTSGASWGEGGPPRGATGGNWWADETVHRAGVGAGSPVEPPRDPRSGDPRSGDPQERDMERETIEELARAGFHDAQEVGRGGFGVVYRCYQSSLNRTVAIKLLHTDLDTISRERFFREGRAMGGLSGHPNVVDVLQVGVTGTGRPYIVMPFQARDSLAQRVRRQGRIPWQEALRYGVRLCGALECAHRTGTLHRDVKPANILVSDYGEAQLTDFGIARIEGGFETTTGAFTGSLSYAAPEVLNGHAPSPASDVYGLGAALYSIVAGKAAYERRTGEELIAQFLRITGQPVPDLREHGVPDDVAAVVEGAMSKDPRGRPASAAELGRRLQDVQRAHGLSVTEMSLPIGRADDGRDRPATGATEIAVLPLEAPSGPHTGSRPGSPGPPGPTDWTDRPPAGPTVPPGRPSLPPPHPPPERAARPPTGPPPEAPSAPVARPPRRRAVVIAAVTVVVALLVSVGVAGWFWLGPGAGTASGPAPVEPVPTWQPLRDALAARIGPATTVADGTVWVLGGLVDGAPSATIEGFDSAINTWKQGPALPVALTSPMAVTYNGELVVLGGFAPGGVASDKVYALRGAGWTELPPMPRARGAGGAAVVGGSIVVTGGQAAGKLVPETEVFDGSAWTGGADLPTPRDGLALVGTADAAYAIGGRDLLPGTPNAVVERYDPAAQTWTRRTDLPSPRGGVGAALVDDRIVVAGGEDGNGPSAAVDVLDVRSGSWSGLPDLPAARHDLAVAAVGKAVVVADGATQSGTAGATAAVTSLTLPDRRPEPAAAWRTLPDAPLARQFAAYTVLDGKVWVMGGLTSGAATAEVQIYDPAAGTWTAGPALPGPLHHVSAVTFRGEIFVIGGWRPDGPNLSAISSDKVYVLRDGRWTDAPPLSAPRVAGAAVVAGDRIVVLGGQNDGQLVSTTEEFDGENWTPTAPMPQPREHTAATTDGRYAYAVGGRELRSDRNLAAVDRYDPQTDTWQELPDLPTARGGLGVAFLDGRIVAAGGEQPTDVLATVEIYDLQSGKWSTGPPLALPRHGMEVVAAGSAVYAMNGATRPTHAASAAAVEALDFS